MGLHPTGNVFKVKCLVCGLIVCPVAVFSICDSFFLFCFLFLILKDKKSLQQICRNSLCGLNRVAIDMDPPRGDVRFLRAAVVGNTLFSLQIKKNINMKEN